MVYFFLDFLAGFFFIANVACVVFCIYTRSWLGIIHLLAAISIFRLWWAQPVRPLTLSKHTYEDQMMTIRLFREELLRSPATREVYTALDDLKRLEEQLTKDHEKCR
jgi:hypothetical protein